MQIYKKLPKLFMGVFRLFIGSEKSHLLNGDFEEVFNDIYVEKGKFRAYLWFFSHFLITLPPVIIRSVKWRTAMFKNYVKTTLRNIKRYKFFSIINISGLALGMASCILIFLYIKFELSYDKYHKNADRIYRLTIDANLGGQSLNIPKASVKMTESLKNEFPGVIDAVMFMPRDNIQVSYGNIQFYEDNVLWAGSSVFNIFSFPFLKGSPENALNTAYTAVITEETAKRYFGGEEPLGKIIRFNNNEDFTVTGVIKDVPENSHFTFDILCSLESNRYSIDRIKEKWFFVNYYSYFLLSEETDYKILEQNYREYVNENTKHLLKSMGGTFDVYFQPLNRIHLHSDLAQDIAPTGSIIYIYIFSVIAVFILVIACINFMNLSTARFITRAREIGLRKVSGANKSGLIQQFLGESIVYSLISLVIALIVVKFAYPVINSLSGTEVVFRISENLWLIPFFIGIAVLSGIFAGSYPAFFLSGFHPADIFRGIIGKNLSNVRLRNVLVLFQFVISIILIIGTFIVINQLSFMKIRELGFNKDHVVYMRIRDNSLRRSVNSIKDALKGIPGVENAAVTSNVPGEFLYKNPYLPEGFTKDRLIWMAQLNIDNNFIPTLGIDLIAGRNFSEEFSMDETGSIIINETAAKKFGWDNPIGKKISAVDPGRISQAGTVIGVIRDFHNESLHKKIEPMLIFNMPERFNYVILKIHSENITSAMKLIENKWNQIDPDRPFEYTFLDNSFDSLYRSDERLSRIFSYFTIFAVFIACLGLLGLVTFSAERRIKEIGIRRVLGASVSNIVFILSKDFLKPVLIANVVAFPVAYYAMNKWLQNFAYRVNINIFVFVLASLIALTVALFTMSVQSYRAATANPVNSLRNE